MGERPVTWLSRWRTTRRQAPRNPSPALVSEPDLARRPDDGLQARAAAALQVLREDPGIDRLELLALVVWPTARLEHVRARPWTDAERERVFQLSAQGLNQYEIARELGRPRSTVAQLLRDGRAALERWRAA